MNAGGAISLVLCLPFVSITASVAQEAAGRESTGLHWSIRAGGIFGRESCDTCTGHQSDIGWVVGTEIGAQIFDRWFVGVEADFSREKLEGFYARSNVSLLGSTLYYVTASRRLFVKGGAGVDYHFRTVPSLRWSGWGPALHIGAGYDLKTTGTGVSVVVQYSTSWVGNLKKRSTGPHPGDSGIQAGNTGWKYDDLQLGVALTFY